MRKKKKWEEKFVKKMGRKNGGIFFNFFFWFFINDFLILFQIYVNCLTRAIINDWDFDWRWNLREALVFPGNDHGDRSKSGNVPCQGKITVFFRGPIGPKEAVLGTGEEFGEFLRVRRSV